MKRLNRRSFRVSFNGPSDDKDQRGGGRMEKKNRQTFGRCKEETLLI